MISHTLINTPWYIQGRILFQKSTEIFARLFSAIILNLSCGPNICGKLHLYSPVDRPNIEKLTSQKEEDVLSSSTIT